MNNKVYKKLNNQYKNNKKGIAISLQYPNLNIDSIIEKIYEVYIKSKRTK